MCFINDYDWTAEVYEESTGPAEKPTHCEECGRRIEVGEPLYHVDMQEHERCGECDGYPGDGGEDECTCEDGPSFGETSTYDCCEECRKFLAAVEAAEIEAGCRSWEARPSLGQMVEEISNGGPDEAKKYFKAAVRLHPELKASGYLKRLWQRLFA